MAETQVIELKKQLVKLIDGTSVKDEKKAADLLTEIGKLKMTAKLLSSTDIGKVVGSLRKTSSASLSSQAKSLVQKWKETCNVGGGVVPSPPPRTPTPSSAPSSSSSTTPSRSLSSGGNDATLNAVLAIVGSLNDEARDKSIKFLASALLTNSDEDSVDKESVAEIARAIEDEVLRSFQGEAKDPYRTKVRSLVFNLGDKKNPNLRRRVLSRSLDVTALCTLSHKELASDEHQQEIAKLEKAIMHDVVEAKPTGQETDMFKCGKCGQRRTRYTQAQTRSADEPMTTFVSCVVCGNKWKFC